MVGNFSCWDFKRKENCNFGQFFFEVFITYGNNQKRNNELYCIGQIFWKSIPEFQKEILIMNKKKLSYSRRFNNLQKAIFKLIMIQSYNENNYVLRRNIQQLSSILRSTSQSKFSSCSTTKTEQNGGEIIITWSFV